MLVAIQPMESVSRLEAGLLRQGKVSPMQLARAQDLARRTYRYLGEVMVEQGVVTVDDIRKAVSAPQ
jgi:hypothetical protein